MSTQEPRNEEDLRQMIRQAVKEVIGEMQADGSLSIEVNGPEGNLEQAEQMAESVMTARDAHRAHKADLSNVEQLRRSYGLDVEDFDDVEQLRQAVRERRKS